MLLSNIMAAVAIVKCSNGTFRVLKSYSSIPESMIKDMVANGKIIKELWPAQKLMAEKGFFSGKSGVVQLPTGAGKTKAIALCILSSLSNGDSNLSIVVAPFRALCREISSDLRRSFSYTDTIEVVELSDILECDYLLNEDDVKAKQRIIVLTPEKLMFVMEQEEWLLNATRQLIFDEGHLFEDKSRGTNYELLISKIIQETNSDTQKILISAIIGDTDTLNQWLTGGAGETIDDNEFVPAAKNFVALNSSRLNGKNYYGFDYINKRDKTVDYYVPRLFEQCSLEDGTVFPTNELDYAIATFIFLAKRENCAIFCGEKKEINDIITRIFELSERGIAVNSIFDGNDYREQCLIAELIRKTYGEELLYKAASIGVFVHHGGLSEGIKSSIEFALHDGKIKNVICTSTLAQGVNLPIKDMIIYGTKQGNNHISKRDFRNLIGRVGRPGMFVEGSIIYPSVLSYKNKDKKWEKYVSLLDNEDDLCISQLENLIADYEYNDSKRINILSLIMHYYENPAVNGRVIRDKLESFDKDNQFSKSKEWWDHVIEVLGSVESFLAKYEFNQDKDSIISLIDSTLIGKKISEGMRAKLETVLSRIYDYVKYTYSDDTIRGIFSKSLMSSEQFNSLVKKFQEEDFLVEDTEDGLLEILIRILVETGTDKNLRKLDSNTAVKIAKAWISGKTCLEIKSICGEEGLKILKRTQKGDIELREIIRICDGGFGYASTLVLNVLSSLTSAYIESGDIIAEKIEEIAFKLKYGLPNKECIYIYELGFNDRIVCQDIYSAIGGAYTNKERARSTIKYKKEKVVEVLEKYPSYFDSKLLELCK